MDLCCLRVSERIAPSDHENRAAGREILDMRRHDELPRTSNGKNFVAARCADANRKWNFKSRFFYKGNPPLTSFSTQNCTVRK